LASVVRVGTLHPDFTVLGGGMRKRLEILKDPEKTAIELRELLSLS
jgi:hypothetical protein